MQVHQFSPTVSYGDAVSNQALSLQRLLRAMGYRSEIFCDELPQHFEGQALSIGQYADYSSPENVLLIHFTLDFSSRVMAWLKQIPDRKVLIYHNVTPHRYFGGINYACMEAAQAGRAQLDHLRTLVEAGWGDSAYNCRELEERGWTRLGVLPIIFEPERYAGSPDPQVLRRWEGGVNVLFVGRVAPNKRFEDLILTFYYLKRLVWPDARLFLVGSSRGMEPYLDFLQALVRRLGLSDVFFVGHVSTPHLIAYYRCASVYLSMSEHEGFGAPLLESMHFGLPIIAYKAAAVPETLGGSGVLVCAKKYEAIAELVGLLVVDEDLRARIVARQRERLQDFLPANVRRRLEKLLHDFSLGR